MTQDNLQENIGSFKSKCLLHIYFKFKQQV